MPKHRIHIFRPLALILLAALPCDARAAEPIVYTVKTPAPDTHLAEIEAAVPAPAAPALDVMMPIWTPGFYKVEDYAARVQDLTARTPAGDPLKSEQTQKNRWRVATGDAQAVVLSYRLNCTGRSVTTNSVGDQFAIFNPGATFIVPVDRANRTYDIRLELPPQWRSSITALDPAADGRANHYLARDYDTLVDSPILAGNFTVQEFDVAGSKHLVADAGDIGDWQSERAAESFKRIVEANARFWGALPYKRYVVLNVFRAGAGGLEHRDSTLLTSSGKDATPGGSPRWLSFLSHEYFHAYNVKRLRPVELGPFDYEQPPTTPSLWVSEGLTCYYQDLLLCRAGLSSSDDFLAAISNFIGGLQTSPGRLRQTLEQSSESVWTGGTSGIGRDNASTVSYYVKGPVVGLLLDAHLRRLTAGEKSLDDVMRLAYKRYGGERGFTPDQFRATAEEIAGCDLTAWFKSALASTDELDYTEALDWYGLQFPQTASGDNSEKTNPRDAWKLQRRTTATDQQKSHLHVLTQSSERN
jgi:predicted metalloprotease with PDZ domain